MTKKTFTAVYQDCQQAFRNYPAPTEDVKLAYHRAGRAILKKLAKNMGLHNGTFDVRSNKGGPAVMGEVTLHTEFVYVQITEGNVMPIMYRTVEGRKDYTGGHNQWTSINMLEDENIGNFADLLNSYKRL